MDEALCETAPVDDPAGVLAAVRAARSEELAATAAQLRGAAQWAAIHEVHDLGQAAGHVPGREGWGTAVPLGGPGCPLVEEFCVHEFAAALGLSHEAGKELLAETLELVHRLPRTWARVQALTLPAWRARRIARATMHLHPHAARFVDAQIAHLAHRVGPTVVDRLIIEAELRHDPTAAAQRRATLDAERDPRCFTVDHRQVSSEGTSRIHGVLDLADALDLDAAITARAQWLADLGCDLPPDHRRALAAGHLARADLLLDLNTTGSDPDPGDAGAAERARPVHATRQVVLYLHLSQAAVTAGTRTLDGAVGRIENTGDLLTAEQIRTWCANPFTQVTVRPVLDLAEHIHTAAYEVPHRLDEQTRLRDLTCAFPWCERKAIRCDTDHAIPHSRGGATCCENLAPLCRRHHRLKTHHGQWHYTVLEPGTYLWRSPHHYRFLRDHTGTRDLTRDPPDRPPGSSPDQRGASPTGLSRP